MDLTSGYCPERKRLEDRNFGLVSTLFGLTDRLMMLVGIDYTEFMATRTRCAKVKQEIRKSRGRLLAHRSTHGC